MEPFTEPAWIGLLVWKVYGGAEAIGLIVLWCWLDSVFYYWCIPEEKGKRTHIIPFYAFMGWWLVRMLASPMIYLLAMVSDNVAWRGNEYKLLYDGRVEIIKSSRVK